MKAHMLHTTRHCLEAHCLQAVPPSPTLGSVLCKCTLDCIAGLGGSQQQPFWRYLNYKLKQKLLDQNFFLGLDPKASDLIDLPSFLNSATP